MLARGFRRSIVELPTQLPPTFLLPFRARLSTTSQQSAATDAATITTPSPDSLLNATRQAPIPAADKPASSQKQQITPSNPSKSSKPIADSVKALLPLLRAQAPHYVTIHIHGRPYLVTAGDQLRLPFLMHGVAPGDVLRLNRATHLGSRDFTLKAPTPVKGTRDGPGKTNYLDENFFVCRAIVTGTESEPMRIMEKTKRRQRHIKHVKSKHRYTILRITELEVKSPEEIEQGGLEGVVAERTGSA